MLELADVFRQYAHDYLAEFGNRMPPSHRRAIADLTACRTRALGGHVYRCDDCGHNLYEYHSCRNSACPKCNGHRREDWLEDRRDEMLPVPYFHVVFTLPTEVAEVARSRQRELYGILFRAAAESLQILAADPRYVGGQIGLLAVLHTWTRTLVHHPHVHCMVPGGALSEDGTAWLPANPRFLVPAKALSKLFRARFQRLVKKTDAYGLIPRAVWRKPWVVNCGSNHSVHGKERVLEYLGRYVSRVALGQRPIVQADNGSVTFAYNERASEGHSGGKKNMTLPANEFIRRFLQHVLPQNFIKIRYYGFWAPTCKREMATVRALLRADEPPGFIGDFPDSNSKTKPPRIAPNVPAHARRCRRCKGTRLTWTAEIRRPARLWVHCRSP